MKVIEQEIKRWKADLKEIDNQPSYDRASITKGIIIGLESALDLIVGPCNTQMHVDAIACKNHLSYETFIEYKFCPDCGQLLHQ